MPSFALPAALALLQAASAPQAPDGIVFAGRVIPAAFPAVRTGDLPTDLKEWDGWGPLKGEPKRPFRDFLDWSQVQAATVKPGAAIWRTKVLLLTQMNYTAAAPDGTLRTARYFADEPQAAQAIQALARVRKLVAWATDGNLDFRPDIEIIEDRFAVLSAQEPAGFYTKLVEPRFNGGRYDAEDRIYRGPYHGVIVLSPAPVDVDPGLMNGTDVRITSLLPASGAPEQTLYATFEAQLESWQKRNVLRRIGPEEYGRLVAFAEPSEEEWRRRYAVPEAGFALAAKPIDDLLAPTAWQNPYLVGLTDDSARGRVLRVVEGTVARQGGVSLPVPEGGLPVAGGSLRFWAKSPPTDPFSIRLSQAARSVRFSLGFDRANREGQASARATAFIADNTWREVRLDLAAVREAGLTAIDEIVLEPSPSAVARGRRRTQFPEILLDDFAVIAEAPTAPAGEDPEEALRRARTANRATAAALSRNLDRDIALNATAALAAEPGPNEEVLTGLADSIDPDVARVATEAIGTLSTPTAQATIRRLLRFGLTDAARVAAARRISTQPTEKTPGELVVLLANRSMLVRLASVEILGGIRTRESGIVRMAYIQQVDPEIKLAVTRLANPTEDYEMRKLQWSVLNEPWDAVRLASAQVLVRSKLPEASAAGFQAVRDDSVWVREAFARSLGASTEARAREALRTALRDSQGRVRAAAVEAWATAPDAKPTDFSVLEADPQPVVQRALLSAHRRRAWPISEGLRATLRNSPDPLLAAESAKAD
jgi:HEAT repeat protein